MQHISPSWHCGRNTHRGPSHRLKTKFLTLLVLLAFALSPRVAWGAAFHYTYNNSTYTSDLLSDAVRYSSDGVIYVTGNTGKIDKDITISRNIRLYVRYTSDYGTVIIKRTAARHIEINAGYTLTIENIIIDGNNVECAYPLFYVNGGTLNMTGNATSGSGYNANNCKIINCKKVNASPTNGGAVHVRTYTNSYGTQYKGSLVCNGVTFSNNDCQDYHTTAQGLSYGGGAISIDDKASFTLNQCVFSNNHAKESGGAILLKNANTSTIRSCSFNSNTADLAGGAIYGIMNSGQTLDIEGTTSFTGNQVVYNVSSGIERMGLGGAACLVTFEGRGCTYNVGKAAGSSISFTNNYARGGGGALVLWCSDVSAHFNLQNFTMEGNHAAELNAEGIGRGGALYVNGSVTEGHTDKHFVIKNGTIRNNYCTHDGGGMFLNMHDCEVEDVTFEGNYTTSSNGKGGGVMIYGNQSTYTHTNSFTNCTFIKNGINGSTTTTKYGGALFSVEKTNIVMQGCTIGGSTINANKATSEGGGLYIGAESYLTLDSYSGNRAIVSYNEAGDNGGGIYVANGSEGHTNIGSSSSSLPVYIKYNKTNTSTGKGGGIYLECGGHTNDLFTLKNFELTNNQAHTGGGAYLHGNIISGEMHGHTAMTISDGTVSANSATNGGGIYFYQHDADIDNVSFTNHSVSGDGGAVYVFGHSNDDNDPHQHDFTNCTFSYNSATNGGGIYMDKKSKVTLDESRIQNNTASINGGGVWVSESSSTSDVEFTLTVRGVGSGTNGRLTYYFEKKNSNNTWTRCRDVNNVESFTDGTTYHFNIPSGNSYRIKMGATESGCYAYYKGVYQYGDTNGETGNISYAQGTTSSEIVVASQATAVASLVVKDSPFTNNSAANGAAVYLSEKAGAAFYGNTANTMKIQNNTASNFGGGVYIGTNGIMGISGEVKVNNNKSTRTTNITYSNSYDGGYQDDVCLQTLKRESKGKIKLLGSITNSYIGITEQQVASNVHRAKNNAGDMMRQFTLNYGTYYTSKAAKDVFYSNDKDLDIKLLLAASPTTTGLLEVTLGGDINEGQSWYVAGIVDKDDFTWGSDTQNSGLNPDVPKRTLTGPNGVFAAGFNPQRDQIFVVRSLSAYEEAKVRLTDGKVVIRYPEGASSATFYNNNTPIADSDGSTEITLYRYPGGHLLSSEFGGEEYDGGEGTTNDGTGYPHGQTGNPNNTLKPGPNVGPVFNMDDHDHSVVMRNIQLYGLSDYSGTSVEPYNPSGCTISPSCALLTVDYCNPYSITLKEDCEIVWNDNKATNNFTNLERREGGGVYCNGILIAESLFITDNNCATNGGGINIATSGRVTLKGCTIGGDEGDMNTATLAGGGVYKHGNLQVEGEVIITDNRSGTSGAKTTYINNVHIPAAAATYPAKPYIEITGELECTSSIGVTKTKDWASTPAYGIDGEHAYEDDMNFEQVRTVIAQVATGTQTWAFDAFKRNVFFDDKDIYGVWSFNYGSDATAYSNQKDYFIETWRCFASNALGDVTLLNSKFVSQVKTAAGLAYLAKHVNNGQSYEGVAITQTTDIDLNGHYWEPIGYSTDSDCGVATNSFFDGNYNGCGHFITRTTSILPAYTMGLFGDVTGAVRNTFAIGGELAYTHEKSGGSLGAIAGTTTGLIDRCEAANFTLEGYAASSYAGGIAGTVGEFGEVRNSFAVGNTVSTATTANITASGGLAGSILTDGKVINAYAKNNTLAGTNQGHLVGSNAGTLANAYSDATTGNLVGTGTAGSNVYSANSAVADETATYTATIGADQLGYMYADNLVGNTPLFEQLTTNAQALGAAYDLWARPSLAEINQDLPVLLMDNYDGSGNIGAGGFRSVGTYGGSGNVLQYGGTTRDGDQVNSALTRTNASGTDYLFIYGDVTVAPTTAAASYTQSKVSIHEHAAITAPGTLKDFANTFVGVTFDNSGKTGMATEGMNGLYDQSLSRDWHLFSTPLSDAPLGFDYGSTNTDSYVANTDYSHTGHYNNPWVNGDASHPGGYEFSWLNGEANTTGNNRYWMGDTDGYFPKYVDGTAVVQNDDLFVLGSDECPSSGTYRYPYGMDFYSWFEPQYHYINFKRNGPNHWHSDENSAGLHEHLAYRPEVATNNLDGNIYGANVNETALLTGKGYMASIATPTLLQSHGHLNEGNQSITVTKTTSYPSNVIIPPGWNLIGNPYHAYLDFDAFSTTNTVDDNQYVVYNADGYKLTDEESGGYSGHYGDGFSYYVKNGSSNGAYASQYLHPHQGFFVKTSSSKNLSFVQSTMAKSRAEAGGGSSYRDGERPAYPLVNLFLSSEKGCSDVCVVEFNRPEWGGGTKLREMYTGNGLFYAFHDNKNYAALFATPDAERIPLKFEAKDEAGDTYTIHWNTQNGDFHRLVLVDNLTGVQYDMLRNSSYSFSGKKGDYYSRFYITFDVTGLDEEQDDDTTGTAATTFAFFDGSQWVVTNDGHGTATLDLIDLQGRVLQHSLLGADGQSRISLPKVAAGMYLLRMNNEKGTRVQKIIVE